MEKYTMFGKTYETVGSPNSNLLLRTKGDLKIQWGTKFIDVVKNGKLAADPGFLFSTVNSSDDITKDGLYVVLSEDNYEIWISLNSTKYLIQSAGSICVSFVEELNTTADQKYLALKNIGFIYDSYESLQSALLTKGIVYVEDTNKLYLIKDSVISEYLTGYNTGISVSQKEDDSTVILAENGTFITTGAEWGYSGVLIGIRDNVGTIETDALTVRGNIDTKTLNVSESGEIKQLKSSKATISELHVSKLVTSSEIIPSGLITQYYCYDVLQEEGVNVYDIPEGWLICDGTEATPNLTSSFVSNTINVDTEDGIQKSILTVLIYIMKE